MDRTWHSLVNGPAQTAHVSQFCSPRPCHQPDRVEIPYQGDLRPRFGTESPGPIGCGHRSVHGGCHGWLRAPCRIAIRAYSSAEEGLGQPSFWVYGEAADADLLTQAIRNLLPNETGGKVV